MSANALKKFTGCIAAFLIIYLITDYFNLPARFGLRMANINMDLLEIILATFTAIIIFLITYYLVDSRSVKIQKNKEETAQFLLMSIYKECRKYVDYIYYDDQCAESLIGKTDFNKLYHGDAPYQKYADIPFRNEYLLLPFMQDGSLQQQQINQYLEIKNNISVFLFERIVFFDMEKSWMETYHTIDEELKKLNI